jgi:hypothetical protein
VALCKGIKIIIENGLRFLKRYAVIPEVLKDTLGRPLTLCPSREFLNNIAGKYPGH